MYNFYKQKNSYGGEYLFTEADVLNIIGDISDLAEAIAASESEEEGVTELEKIRLKWDNLTFALSLMRQRVDAMARERWEVEKEYQEARKKVKRTNVFDKNDKNMAIADELYGCYSIPGGAEKFIKEKRSGK